MNKRVWEARHPQEFVRAVRDDMRVEPTRPPPIDTYIGPLTTFVMADAPAGAIALTVLHTARMQRRDRIALFLADGNQFVTTIEHLTSATTLTIVDALPQSITAGTVLSNLTAISPPVLA